jgi:hypothetical protein
MLVAVATPKVGVTKVGEVVPAKEPVPLAPDRPTPTLFIVAIINPFLSDG